MQERTKVRHEAWEGKSQALLQELHLLTRDGVLNQDARRKIKQIYHLMELLKPALEELAKVESPRIIDVGAGKSYLGFILYDLWMRDRTGGRITSIEIRKDLVERSTKLATNFGFDRMDFLPLPIAELIDSPLAQSSDQNPQLVTALHACDTATDDAIHFALANNARFLALVPCCQAEVARMLGELPPKSELWPLWRHPIQRREFGSHLTNVIRALYLESHGYKVRVTELTGWEHSMKNEFIFAEKIQASNPLAERQLKELLDRIPVIPKVISRSFMKNT